MKMIFLINDVINCYLCSINISTILSLSLSFLIENDGRTENIYKVNLEVQEKYL